MNKILSRCVKIFCVAFLLPLFLLVNNVFAEAVEVSTADELSAYFTSGGEVKLTSDITFSANKTVKADLVLDLNGHTLNMSDKTLVVSSAATLTIKDTSANNDGKITSTASFTIQIGSSTTTGKVVLESGNIDCKGSYGVRVLADSSLTVNGGKIVAKRFAIYNQSETVINDGEVLGTNNVAIQNHNNGNLIINGGTIKTEADYQAINMYGNCTATMNGGNIIAMKEGTEYSGQGFTMFKNTELIINGGTITTYGPVVLGNGSGSEAGSSEGSNAKVTINGGTLSSSGAGPVLYLPSRNGVHTITGGTITGPTGVEIRAGTLTVTGGTINGTAAYENKENSNGGTTDGAAISIAQHTTKQPITVNIEGGNFNADHPISFTNPENNPPEDLAKITINITGGTYTGNNYDDLFGNLAEDQPYYRKGSSVVVGEEPEEEILVPDTGNETIASKNEAGFDVVTQIVTISTLLLLFLRPITRGAYRVVRH